MLVTYNFMHAVICLLLLLFSLTDECHTLNCSVYAADVSCSQVHWKNCTCDSRTNLFGVQLTNLLWRPSFWMLNSMHLWKRCPSVKLLSCCVILFSPWLLLHLRKRLKYIPADTTLHVDNASCHWVTRTCNYTATLNAKIYQPVNAITYITGRFLAIIIDMHPVPKYDEAFSQHFWGFESPKLQRENWGFLTPRPDQAF